MVAFIWEQGDDETPKAYAAFRVYRDAGANRSLEKTRLSLGKDSPGYKRVLSEWSSKYEWVRRAEAWDKHQQQLLDAERNARRQTLVDLEVADYEKLIAKWGELFGIAQPLKTTRTIKNEDGSTTKVLAVNTSEWRALTRLRREISSIGRRAMGLPEVIANTQHTGADGNAIDITFTYPDDNDSD